MVELNWDKVDGLIPAIVQDHENVRNFDAWLHEQRSIKNFAKDWFRYIL